MPPEAALGLVLLTVHCDAPTFTAVPVPKGHFECGYLELEGDFRVIVFDGAPSKKRKDCPGAAA